MALIPACEDGQGILLLSMCAIFSTLAFLAVAFRLWARQMKNTRLAVNDFAIIAALLFGTGLVVIVLIAVLKGGMGQHAKDLQASQLDTIGKILTAGSPVWATANMFIKISILHLYCTIFWNRTFRIMAYTVMAFAICLGIAIILQAFLICRPFAFNWDPMIPGGHCGNNILGYKAQTIINIAIDSAIVLLPIPLLWRLQMTWPKKLGVYFMFSLGVAICVITGLRYRAASLLDPSDITYTAADFALLSMLETTLGIVNTCLPVCRPSLKKLYPATAFAVATRLLYTRGSGRSHGINRRYGSSSTDKDSSKKVFQRIDNVDQQYPLTSIVGTQTENTIIGGTKLIDSESQSDHSESTKYPQNITVFQQWEVNSNPSTVNHGVV